jgi:hypothetical protein
MQQLRVVGSIIIASGILAACGGLLGISGDDPPPTDPIRDDASADGSVSTADGGATPPTPRCNPNAAFGSLEAIPELSDPSLDESGMTLTEDELTAYVGIGTTIDVPATRDMVLYERASTTSPWVKKDALTALNSTFEDDNASISGDGLTLFFHSTRADAEGEPPRRVWFATRTSKAEAFENPNLAPDYFNTDGVHNVDPFILPDKSAVFWGTDREGNFDIWESTSTGANPRSVGAIATAAVELQPVVSADGLELFFARAEALDPSLYEIWRSTRTNRNDSFGAPEVLSGLNVPNVTDLPSWISADHCVLYVVSSRAGSRDMYVAKRGK